MTYTCKVCGKVEQGYSASKSICFDCKRMKQNERSRKYRKQKHAKRT